MAPDVIEGVAGDAGQVLGVTLKDKTGSNTYTARDLTGVDSIECHMTNRETGTTTTITGLTGDATGNVATPLPTLTRGTFLFEWEVVTDGGDTIDTYPSRRTNRLKLTVREEDD